MKELADSIERALRGSAMGALAALNAHFYSSSQRSFVEAVLVSPLEAYREAVKVMPESMVKILFKMVLRALGAPAHEAEAAVDAVSRGDASAFSALVRRYSESWRGRGGYDYGSGGIFWLAGPVPTPAAGPRHAGWACWQARMRGHEVAGSAAC